MTGLLHRLASQAMGKPSPIRPIARLPFSPAPALIEQGSETSAPGPPITDSIAAAPIEAPPVPQQEQQVPDEMVSPAAREPADEVVLDPPSAGGAPTALPAVLPAEVVTNWIPELPAPPESAHVPAPAPIAGKAWAARQAPVPDRSERRDRIEPTRESVPGGTHEVHIVTGTQEPETFGAAPEVRLSATAGDPDPLLPLRAPIAHAPAPSMLPAGLAQISAREPAGEQRVEEITEVHVNIGRIEITALQEAPQKPVRRATAERKPMSLEDYLARRQGGGR